MVSSFLVVNHYFLVNFNYVDSWLPFRVIQTAWIHPGVQQIRSHTSAEKFVKIMEFVIEECSRVLQSIFSWVGGC